MGNDCEFLGEISLECSSLLNFTAKTSLVLFVSSLINILDIYVNPKAGNFTATSTSKRIGSLVSCRSSEMGLIRDWKKPV